MNRGLLLDNFFLCFVSISHFRIPPCVEQLHNIFQHSRMDHCVNVTFLTI